MDNVHKSSDMEGRATQNLKCLQILEILEVASRWGGFGERMLTLGNRTNRHLPQSPEKKRWQEVRLSLPERLNRDTTSMSAINAVVDIDVYFKIVLQG